MSIPDGRPERNLSAYDKFGIVSSIIGLLADFIALGSFGYSLLNRSSTDVNSNLTISLWIGIILIVPLIYSWGFLVWLANSRYGKSQLVVLLTGLVLLPLYEFWGIIVLAQAFPIYYENDIGIITAQSRAIGGLVILLIQILLGVSLNFALRLWNVITGTLPSKS